MEPATYIYVYFILLPDGNVKIGRTIDLQTRLASLSVKYGSIKLLLAIATLDYRLEPALHSQFVQYRVSNEVFKFSTELSEYIAHRQNQSPYPRITIDPQYQLSLREQDIALCASSKWSSVDMSRIPSPRKPRNINPLLQDAPLYFQTIEQSIAIQEQEARLKQLEAECKEAANTNIDTLVKLMPLTYVRLREEWAGIEDQVRQEYIDAGYKNKTVLPRLLLYERAAFVNDPDNAVVTLNDLYLDYVIQQVA